MAEKQKALKGRQHQTGRGPAGVPQAAKVPGSQTRRGQMGLGPGTPVPRAEGPGQRLRVAATTAHALLLPSQLPTPGRRGRRPEERLPNCPGHGGAGCGMRALRGQQPLSPSLSCPQAQHNHLVSGNSKGFSYQRKLKVTLLLIDLAMFVNYSVTDVAKDN